MTLVVSILYGTGAHWAALQGAAWAGMLATRVQRTSWAEAVASTFSGTKPCHVCRVVERGSTADPRPVASFRTRGTDFAVAAPPVLIVRTFVETSRRGRSTLRSLERRPPPCRLLNPPPSPDAAVPVPVRGPRPSGRPCVIRRPGGAC